MSKKHKHFHLLFVESSVSLSEFDGLGLNQFFWTSHYHLVLHEKLKIVIIMNVLLSSLFVCLFVLFTHARAPFLLIPSHSLVPITFRGICNSEIVGRYQFLQNSIQIFSSRQESTLFFFLVALCDI